MLLKKHRCTLNLGSYSMLPKKPNAGFWCRQLRKLRKLSLVSYNHPCIARYYKSYPAVVAERQRQIIEGGRYLLHPISKFSLYWQSLMILVNLSHMTLSPLRLCFVLEPPGFKVIHTMDRVLLGLHVVCLVDIVVNLNTGFFTGENRQSVMDRSRILWHYFRGFLVPDLISSLPVAYVMLSYHKEDDDDTQWLLVAHLMPFLRFARIFTVMWDMKHFMKLCTRSYLVSSFIRHSMLFMLIIHWFTCMVYLFPVLRSYINDEEARGYNFFLRTRGLALYKYSIYARYMKSLFICVSAFFGSGFSLFSVWEDDEILMGIIIIMLGSAFMSYIGVYIMRMYITHFNSRIRYNELMDQLEKYMRNKQFPESLKTRLLQLYQYHFQGQYFKEAEALDVLSDQLRHEISFYTCHKLVDKVKLFEGLTATLVGTILGCLKPEIYLRNDLLVRAGDIGECMYFIASGTVQVLSSKGAEVCHLMDGAHFGEVALLMRDSKRVATIIALETTLVYRLDTEDFQRYVKTDGALFSRIEELASHRMHESVLLDEEFRKEREHRADMDKSSQMEHSN